MHVVQEQFGDRTDDLALLIPGLNEESIRQLSEDDDQGATQYSEDNSTKDSGGAHNGLFRSGAPNGRLLIARGGFDVAPCDTQSTLGELGTGAPRGLSQLLSAGEPLPLMNSVDDTAIAALITLERSELGRHAVGENRMALVEPAQFAKGAYRA